jgi:hypothetical protein
MAPPRRTRSARVDSRRPGSVKARQQDAGHHEDRQDPINEHVSEFSKRLDALLIQSPAMISIDNANGRLIRGDTLEAILSEGVADVRPLGRSETVRVRNRSFIVATGNNLIVTGDMARRALVLDLIPKPASPERDLYPFNPAEMVQKHRTALLQAAFHNHARVPVGAARSELARRWFIRRLGVAGARSRRMVAQLRSFGDISAEQAGRSTSTGRRGIARRTP